MTYPDDEEDDPTLMRNQASLTTSTGRSWLLLGGLLTFIAAVVLAFELSLEPPGVALFGLVSVLVLYAAMVVVRLTTEPGRVRLGILAGLMIAIAVIGLGCVIVVAYAAFS
jgi:hypothetical protein